MKYHGPPLAERGLFCAMTQRGFRRSSVIGSTSKSDIKSGQEDKLTEMLICPHGGRIRDPKGSEDMCKKWGMDKGPFPGSCTVDLSSAEQVAISQIPVFTWWPRVVLSPINVSVYVNPLKIFGFYSYRMQHNPFLIQPVKKILPWGFTSSWTLVDIREAFVALLYSTPCMTSQISFTALSHDFPGFQFLTDLILLISKTGFIRSIQTFLACPAPNLGKVGQKTPTLGQGGFLWMYTVTSRMRTFSLPEFTGQAGD